MIIEILNADLELFKAKPTEQFFITELHKDLDEDCYNAKYIFIDENKEIHEKDVKALCTKKNQQKFENDIRELYYYLIYLNSTKIYDKAVDEDKKFIKAKKKELFLIGTTALAVCMSPMISYSIVNFNSNPKLNSLIILLETAYIIRCGMNIPAINELSQECYELIYKIDKMLFEEGERLVRKKR